MKEVLILGNGISRKSLQQQILNWKKDVWVCNWAFKEATTFDIKRVYSLHHEVIPEAFNFRKLYNLNYKIVSRKGLPEKYIDLYFKKDMGWSTGNLTIIDALEEGYEKIVLVGFDFGGWDIYQPNKLPGDNFFKQFNSILKMYGNEKIFFLQEDKVISVKEKIESSESPIWKSLKHSSNNKIVQKEFFKSFSPSNLNDKILIIGNSPGIFDNELKEVIDNDFDIVVRINDFITEGYEKYIGSKTDIWFTGANRSALIKSRNIKNLTPLVGLPFGRARLLETEVGVNKLKEDIEKALEIPFNRLQFLSKEVTLEIQKKLNMHNPSTGFLCLYYFIEYLNYKNVTIHGFDFFKNKYHYYDTDQKMKSVLSTAHKFEKEKMIVDKWIKENKIKTLTQYNDEINKGEKHIFVFGNSPEIRDVDFNLIKDLQKNKDFITVGINRIFKVFQPNILFFMDGAILDLLEKENIQRDPESKWLIPIEIFNNPEYQILKTDYIEYIKNQKIEELNIDFYKFIHKKSSLIWLIYYLQNFLYKDFNCKFYLNGVSLNVSNTEHYFDGSCNEFFKTDKLQNQYNSQYQGIIDFYKVNENIYSMTKNSKLNDFLPFIENDLTSFIREKIPNKKNKALVSLMTPEFLIAYPVFIKSLLLFNSWFNLPIILLEHNLTDEQKEFCKKIYSNTKFRTIKTENYNNVNFSSTVDSLKNTYYKLDIFSIEDYDSIVFIDLDVVFQGDISELFERIENILLVPSYNAKADNFMEEANSGVIVINKKYLNEKVYKELIKESEKGFNLPDQAVINNYFKGRITYLNKMYNCEKRILKSEKFKSILKTARIIHFVSQKPWQENKTITNQGFEELEKIWWDLVEDKNLLKKVINE